MNLTLVDPRREPRLPSRISCVDCPARRGCLPGASDLPGVRAVERLVSRRCKLAQGEHLFWMDQHAMGKLYAIRSGQFKLYQLSPQGRQQVAGFGHPGDVLGLDAVGMDIYRCGAVALCDSLLCEFSLPQLAATAGREGGAWEHLGRVLSRCTAREQWLAVQLGHGQALQKMAGMLLDMMQRLPADAPLRLPLYMSRQDIADFLGITAATVSRTLRRLERDGIVAMLPQGVRVRDAQQLRRAAGWLADGAGSVSVTFA